MRTFKILIIALFAVVTFESCTIAKFNTKGSVPVILSQPTDDMELIEHVKFEKTYWFNKQDHDINTLLAKEIAEKKPDAIANLSMEVKVTVKSYLMNYITCGLGNAHTVIIEADFMQYSDPNSPKKKKRGRK